MTLTKIQRTAIKSIISMRKDQIKQMEIMKRPLLDNIKICKDVLSRKEKESWLITHTEGVNKYLIDLFGWN